MFIVDGESFNDSKEYELALQDKATVDLIKKKCDLNTAAGIKKAYDEVKNCNFKTKVGNKFDDEIFELYEDLKNKPNVEPLKTKPSLSGKKAKESKDFDKPMDEKTKKAVLKEVKKINRKRNILIGVLFAIGVFSIGYFVKYYSDARKVQKTSEEYADLKDDKYADILKNVTASVKKDYSEEVVIPDILDEYVALYNKNKSLIGWIKIADTVIDYPVMQTEDNEYYLKHNFNQESDANGCIFMDASCDVILGNDNWILYGHHMKNGKMFSCLSSYANYDWYEKHKTIEFDTIYEKGTYEVMYAFRSKIYNTDEIVFKYYQFIDASSEEEFISNMEEMDKLSLIDTGVTASYGDRLLTLSTCDYQESNGRFVVVAKKID